MASNLDKDTFSAFVKEAGRGEALATAAVAAGAGLAVYDVFRARGLAEDSRQIQRELSGKTGRKSVDLKAYLKKRDPNVKVITTNRDVDRFVSAEKLEGFRGQATAIALKQALRENNNAFAYRGKSGDYIIGAKKIPKAIADHEHGHILDFRDKNIISDASPRMGEYVKGSLDNLSQAFFKHRFTKGRYRAEEEAWRRAEVAQEDKDLEALALGTYEKSFHLTRASMISPLVGWGGLELAARRLRNRRPRF